MTDTTEQRVTLFYQVPCSECDAHRVAKVIIIGRDVPSSDVQINLISLALRNGGVGWPYYDRYVELGDWSETLCSGEHGSHIVAATSQFVNTTK